MTRMRILGAGAPFTRAGNSSAPTPHNPPPRALELELKSSRTSDEMMLREHREIWRPGNTQLLRALLIVRGRSVHLCEEIRPPVREKQNSN